MSRRESTFCHLNGMSPKYLFAIAIPIGVLTATLGAFTQASVCSCPAQIAGQPNTCYCPMPLTYFLAIFIGASMAIGSFAGLLATLTRWL